MTNLQKEQVQKAIPNYCKAKGISANDLAKKAVVSAATISQMKNGNWESIEDKLWRKVWNVVNPETAGIIQTIDSKSVFELAEKARKHCLMIGLTGDTGMGKSTALKAVAMRANVFYNYIDPTVTPKVFLKGLLHDMNTPFEGSINAMLTKAAEELNTLNSPLVIIDESGKLSDAMILTLHCLRDKTILNCGMVLAGMPEFKIKLIGFVNRGKQGYSEFFRRINMWHELKGLTASEINGVLESNGITDKATQMEFKKLNRFGDLMNEIILFKEVNA
jgi:DNA transposition AAA+ family ATPase